MRRPTRHAPSRSSRASFGRRERPVDGDDALRIGVHDAQQRGQVCVGQAGDEMAADGVDQACHIAYLTVRDHRLEAAAECVRTAREAAVGELEQAGERQPIRRSAAVGGVHGQTRK